MSDQKNTAITTQTNGAIFAQRPEKYQIGETSADLEREQAAAQVARQFGRQVAKQMAGKRYAAAIAAGLLTMTEVPKGDQVATLIECRAVGLVAKPGKGE